MKRFLTLSTVILMLFALAVPISAANYDDQVAPCYNNTMQTTSNFNISESGLASVNLVI